MHMENIENIRTSRVTPEPPLAEDEQDAENDLGWGYKDTRFEALANGSVVLTGSRYNLCGFEMPGLLPWLSKSIGADLDPNDQVLPQVDPEVAPARDLTAFLDAIKGVFEPDQLTQDDRVRLRHGHGHTGLEIYALFYERLPRVPDLVVYPTNHDQVAALVSAANDHRVVLIPYGGGTNVTRALECPSDEERPIVSVDMKRMNRILWIDERNRLAKIEAGAAGRTIMKQLAQAGFTIGHEPDSVEFSTLGGWVATNCSGMKKSRYGNIEDIVTDLTVATSLGVVERHTQCPRESSGIDSRRCLFGSEGALGIVTSATVRLHPLPEVSRFASLIFPSFEAGFAFLQDVERERIRPASIRLMDNVQFQFGMALKAEPTWWEERKSRLTKLALTKLRGMDLSQCALATVVFEGSAREVKAQQRELLRLARAHSGLPAGSDNGERGYNLTFGIAYLRDLVLRHHVLAESFETSVGWGEALELCRRVKARCADKHSELGLPGKPALSYRITQLYPTGVCIYFYLALYTKGVADPILTYAELEEAARDEILACGGSLSHHHGVGKLRAQFLNRVQTPAMNAFNRGLKAALDPRDVFACRNQGLLGGGNPQPAPNGG
jgi:alkyldihydroxyacetonephosphate synthase